MAANVQMSRKCPPWMAALSSPRSHTDDPQRTFANYDSRVSMRKYGPAAFGQPRSATSTMNLPPGISPLPNTADLVVLSDSHDLLIKRYYPLVIRLDFPKGLQPGQSVSNFQLLMQIKKNLEAHKLTIHSGRVLESTVDYVKFHALMESQDAIEKATRRLLKQKIKAATFKTPLSVNVEKVRMLSQSERDWETYFDKAEGMDPKVPGKRPDTMYLSKLPVEWFRHRDGLPDECAFKKIFSKFGEVRAVDIPRADIFRSKMSADISGIRTGTLIDHQDTTFEAYIQFTDYPGFATAMKFFGGYAKLVWRGHNGNGTGYLQADILVDFNRDCHLCPEKIKKRSEERRVLKEKEHEEQKSLKRKEDEERRKCEEEEKAAKKKAEEEAAAQSKLKEQLEAEEVKNRQKNEEAHNHQKHKDKKEMEAPAKIAEEKSHRRHSDSKKRRSTDGNHSNSKSSSERKRTSGSPSRSHERSSEASRASRPLRNRNSHSDRRSSHSRERNESRHFDEKRRKLSCDDHSRRSKKTESRRKHTRSLTVPEKNRRTEQVRRSDKPKTKHDEEMINADDAKEQQLRELLLQEREKQLRAKLLAMHTNEQTETQPEKEEMEAPKEEDDEEQLREYLLQKQEEKLREHALKSIHQVCAHEEPEQMEVDGQNAPDDEESELRELLLQQREQALRAKLTHMVPKSIS
ncbi:hypothetical protein QR680_008819 [Steinernema hermaphroditum]|uniref:Uncharacterized protein n=1 Tax=Steinernema hermaphroditum TaxID=289476 RepID=A0AA39II30_9BILA|nr:hypothetical protein QR680_008819 [Steinernema hermaphroditum]